jgi:hypothetical protein
MTPIVGAFASNWLGDVASVIFPERNLNASSVETLEVVTEMPDSPPTAEVAVSTSGVSGVAFALTLED